MQILQQQKIGTNRKPIMINLKEYVRLYPAVDGKISKNTKRLQHVIEELKNIKSENIDGDIYDEFENALNDLNRISKNFKKGSNKYK